MKHRVVHVSRLSRTVVSPPAGRGLSSSIPRTTLWISSGMVLYRQPPPYLGSGLVTCGANSSTRRLVVAASGAGLIKVSPQRGTPKRLDSAHAWDCGTGPSLV